MHLGEIEVRYLDGGKFGLDGGAMFGVVPKPLWEKKSPPDEKNRIRMRANSLLVRTGGKNILIETGNGTKLDPKLKTIYKVGDGDPLTDAMHAAGVQAKDIDIVINTHLHFDHAGGNTIFRNELAIPAFPRARYIVQKRELEHAAQPTERDRASYFPENYQPMIDSNQWDLVDGAAEILPGISVEKVPGHNADMQAVKLTAAGRTWSLLRICFRHVTIFLCLGLWPTICIRCSRSKQNGNGCHKFCKAVGSQFSGTIPTWPRPLAPAREKNRDRTGGSEPVNNPRRTPDGQREKTEREECAEQRKRPRSGNRRNRRQRSCTR